MNHRGTEAPSNELTGQVIGCAIRFSGLASGLILNFKTAALREGIKRMVL